MIQNVIARMSQNSFLLKGWSVTLVAGLLALAAGGAIKGYIYLAYFPIAVFWYLDGYYLSQERLFRGLYDRVRHLDEHEIDYSMDTSDVSGFNTGWSDTVFSKTLILFYLILIVSILVVILLMP